MPEPKIVTPPAKKRLALFLDGTWNAVDDNTNVWRLKSLCSGHGADGLTQLVYYEIGVNGLWGGALGKGLDRVITDGYEWLIDHYRDGDDIFIFGFSRGAYAARSLAGLIAKCGLLRPGAALGVKQLYARYRRADAATIWQLIENHTEPANVEERWLLKYSQPVHIKVVAVWDTVGALGVPFGNIPGLSRASFKWLSTGLRIPIDNAYHALAIDEHRRAFEPTLWTVRRPDDPHAVVAPPRELAAVEQRWFVGAHANVGGGCENDLLPQIPLRWIMKKASQHGLAFKADVDLDDDATLAHVSDSYRAFLHGIYSIVSPPYRRPIGAEPKRVDGGIESTVNETIDLSVFDRWRADPSYRPPGLVDWANRKAVTDPAMLRTSVLAERPATAAPD